MYRAARTHVADVYRDRSRDERSVLTSALLRAHTGSAVLAPAPLEP